LIETLETLDRAQIQHVGAGINAIAAAAPVIIKRRGIKVGILGCTDNEPTWKASEAHPGIVYLDVGDLDTIRDAILQLRPQVDLLILSMHWGPNMRERPSADFRAFAHQLILYDTGDFVDDYAIDPFLRNDRSFFS
jgi:poly-gamma-glutamate capsule biosynthesis protein CapA/YwtB (metallophosphatase superfamily)